MGIKFSNNAYGTLNASISSSDTSLTLSSGQGARFPTLTAGDYFYATLIDTSNNLEVVKCTAISSDVLTITRAQESTTARAFAIGDRLELRVTAAGLEDAGNPYDKDTSSTGSFALPSGTTAQQPAAADTEGHIRYDTDDSVVYYSNGTSWLKISSVIATLSSVTGNIFAGSTSTLTLSGQGFQTANLVVNFLQSSDAIDEDVTVTPTSDISATVTVPAAVYNNVTSGNVVSVSVTNSDGITSGVVTKTALALPSGGTVTTSGGYRIHTFTSSGTFTNTVASLSCEYLIIAGGGGGGSHYYAGGGGAGGYRCSVSGESSGGGSSAESAFSASVTNYTVTVGGGGAGGTTRPSRGTSGVASSVFGISSTGGGGGGTDDNGSTGRNGLAGGSGGGAGKVTGGNNNQGTAGAGTTGQGYKGGGNNGANIYNGSGGGGAGAVGRDGTTGSPYGTGGAGVASSITGTSVTRAGGGGGATDVNNTPSGPVVSGGSGGGGNSEGTNSGNWTSGPFIAATAGATNTGGGGGGGCHNSMANGYGASGGSGVVIIRYQL